MSRSGENCRSLNTADLGLKHYGGREEEKRKILILPI